MPHLSDAAPGDREFWRDYISDNTAVSIVAKEFQTGNKPLEVGKAFVDEIDAIQQHVGRPLHPILIGGARLTEHAALRFQTFTILDSRPFMGAVNRQSFQEKGRRSLWRSDPTLPGFGIDALLAGNLRHYSDWISIRAKSKGNLVALKARKTG